MIEPQPHPEGTGKVALRTATHTAGIKVKGDLWAEGIACAKTPRYGRSGWLSGKE